MCDFGAENSQRQKHGIGWLHGEYHRQPRRLRMARSESRIVFRPNAQAASGVDGAQVAALLELKCAAIRDAFTGIEHPDCTPQNVRDQAERSLSEHEMKVKSSAWPHRSGGLDESAACTQVHNADDAARSQRRVRDVLARPAVSRIAATILYELTHDREPDSYFRTRVRPVAPSTRMAY